MTESHLPDPELSRESAAGRAGERRALLALLDAHGLRTKRALGQNFIYARALLERMCDAALIGPHDRVLEIGSGAGTLSEALLDRLSAGQLLSVEIDAALRPLLLERLAGRDNLRLRFADAARLDLRAEMGALAATRGALRVMANLPYYLTTELIEKCLCALPEAASMAFLVQSEAAQRILAGPAQGKAYGPLAVMVRAYGRARRVLDLPAQAFLPPPHVDSVMVLLERGEAGTEARVGSEEREAQALRQWLDGERAAFLRFVELAFRQRRKTLANNLKSLGEAALRSLERRAAERGWAEGLRAEALDWTELALLYRGLREEGALPGGAAPFAKEDGDGI